MDQHLNNLYQRKIEQVIVNLEKNNMKGTFIKDRESLINYMDEQIKDNATVAVGGSQTLFELDLINYIRNRNVEFFDRYEEGLSPQAVKNVFRKSFMADVYLTSTNALTSEGYLYSVDGTGNRVAATLYGPDKVYVIVGINKLVGSVEEAVARVEEKAAPANCTRLNRNTPCVKMGSCVDCKVPERICNEYTLIKRQGVKDRIEVLILPFELGY
ncbi:MAG: lactate utilization protein [Clostridiaceae bacterium]